MISAERELEQFGTLDKAEFKEYNNHGAQVNPRQIYTDFQALRLNYAACLLKLGDFKTVIVQCSEVLKRDPENVKALFRRGVAYMKLGRDLEDARKDLIQLAQIAERLDQATRESLEKDVAREMNNLEKLEKNYENKEKKMFSKIFA